MRKSKKEEKIENLILISSAGTKNKGKAKKFETVDKPEKRACCLFSSHFWNNINAGLTIKDAYEKANKTIYQWQDPTMYDDKKLAKQSPFKKENANEGCKMILEPLDGYLSSLYLDYGEWGSGVKSTFYKEWYNGEWTNWMEYNQPVSLTGEGTHYIVFYSVDNLGNVEDENNFTFFIDVVPPPSPNLLSPENGGSTTNTPSFDWNDVEDVSDVYYTLQISTDEYFENIAFEEKNLIGSSYIMKEDEALSMGTYYWRVRAVDGVNNSGEWSETWSFTVTRKNSAPGKPSTPSGPTTGKINVSYTYPSSTTDIDGDRIQYIYDWGDGTLTWTGWYNSGEIANASHVWYEKGTYSIRVKAIDEHGAESEWSDPLPVKVPYTWLIEVVDSTGDVGLYSSSTVDSNGSQYCGYYDETNGDLKFAMWDGEQWHIEVVDSYGDVGMYTSLALGSYKVPHIVYYDNTNHDLKYARRVGENWSIESVDTGGNVGWSASIALMNDTPHISYYDFTNNRVKYATRGTDGWHIEIVDDGGIYTSIGVKSDGTPCIAYTGDGGGIKYAERIGETWVITTVDGEAEGWDVSLAIDYIDRPHISYYGNGYLKHAIGYESGFETESVDYVTYGGWGSSIDTHGGDPCISYYDYSDKDLKYARRTAEGWAIETVDAEGDVGWHSSLSLQDGYAHITYYDVTDGDLKKGVEGVIAGNLQIESVFQPVQVVWQDAPVPPTESSNRLKEKIAGELYEAEISMIEEKNTLLFGYPYNNRFNITVSITNNYNEDRKIKLQFRIKPGDKVVYTYQNVITVKEGETKTVTINVPKGIPDEPFRWESSGTGSVVLEALPADNMPLNSNKVTVEVEIVDTNPLRITYFPIRTNVTGWAYENFNAYTRFTETANEFVQGTYPLAENEFSGYDPLSLFYRNPRYVENWMNQYLKHLYFPLDRPSNEKEFFKDLERIYKDLGRFTVKLNFKRSVALLPSNFFEEFGKNAPNYTNSVGLAWPSVNSTTVLVEIPAYPPTVAHELAHTFGLNLPINSVSTEEYDVHPEYRAYGFWVNKKEERYRKFCFMNCAVGINNTWVCTKTYEALIPALQKQDPASLFLSGTAYKNNTIVLEEAFWIPQGYVDIAEGVGNYSVVLTKDGTVLAEYNFTLNFHSPLGGKSLYTVDSIPFAFRVPWINGTEVLQIRDADENVLAELEVSPNAPQLTVTYPNGGEIIHPGNCTITWNAHDVDGDNLTFDVMLSNDGGENWIPIGFDLNESTYTCDLSIFPAGDSYLIKVLACDGVNTGQDTSDATFTISSHFDTGLPSNPYPSICGRHTGTIKSNRTVIASKLYTYPCAGTGGHAEYAKIWNTTGWNATAIWKGYKDDWHNIYFDKPVILMPNETYSYEIHTGSYPMIHHTNALLTESGWINCTSFVDANGKVYYDWIPAIRLE